MTLAGQSTLACHCVTGPPQVYLHPFYTKAVRESCHNQLKVSLGHGVSKRFNPRTVHSAPEAFD